MNKSKGCESRTRRHIFINDAMYKRVAVEAIERDVDYGAIIEEALKIHFTNKNDTEERE